MIIEILSTKTVQLRHKFKEYAVIHKTDAELAELLPVDRVSITRWKNQTRFPKFDEVLKYEEILGLPFECFISREPNLEAIKEKLEMQLKAVKKAIKEKEQESLI